MPQKQTTFSLKDQLFNTETVSRLADQFMQAWEDFPRTQFITQVCDKFPHLELKERIAHISTILRDTLPQEYPRALQIILDALPTELDPNKTDNDFGEFIISPLSHFVAEYGYNEQYRDMSRQALQEITKRFSVEFSVRTFINKYPNWMYDNFQELISSNNYHQRRLVSEGSRLTLPWAVNISRTPEQVIKLLDQLYTDTTRYVTRSVANNLNGISKTHPDLVIDTLTRWRRSNMQQEQEMHYIIKHSLRTLLKQGYTPALRMLGYHDSKDILIDTLSHDAGVTLGSNFSFSGTLSSKKGSLGKCRIEYAIGYLKANGKHNEKVFKIADIDSLDTTYTFQKHHSFKTMTTRTHYLGEHYIMLIVNGKRFEKSSFLLK